MALEKFKFPAVISWYNSDKSKVTGAFINTAGSNNYIRIYPTSYTLYSMDLSGTSANERKEYDLFEYANGVKIRASFYVSSENTDYIIVQGSMFLCDMDNNKITISGVPSEYSIYMQDARIYGDTIENVKFYYSPPQVMFSGSLPNANRFDVFGTYIYARNNPSPYDAPEIVGVNEEYNRANFGIYWNVSETSNITTDDLFDRLLQGIIDNGDGTIITPISPEEDTSKPSDGESDYNPFSDPVDFPDLPIGGGALSTGFVHIYNPTNTELQNLAGELWSDSFITEIKKIQNDPLEAIVSLHSVPFGPVTGGSALAKIGNYQTEVSMPVVTAQYYTIDCGQISVPEHWASALDYAPYTQAEIFLPFVGVKPLQIDDIMNKVLNVRYNVDILTGAAICMLKCGDSVLYAYNTEIVQNIPFSASSHAQLYQSIINAAGAVVGIMGGGAGAIVSGVQSAASVAASKHSQVSRGGSLGGTVGVLGDFVPYLIIHRPIQSLAADFAHKKGYPSNITATLSSVSGYTEIDSIHLENIACTDSERNELYSILHDGVIL